MATYYRVIRPNGHGGGTTHPDHIINPLTDRAAADAVAARTPGAYVQFSPNGVTDWQDAAPAAAAPAAQRTVPARQIDAGTVVILPNGTPRAIAAVDDTRTHVYVDFADGGSGIYAIDAAVTVAAAPAPAAPAAAPAYPAHTAPGVSIPADAAPGAPVIAGGAIGTVRGTLHAWTDSALGRRPVVAYTRHGREYRSAVFDSVRPA